MDTYKTLQHETDNKISGKKRTNILEKLAIGSSNLTKYNSFNRESDTGWTKTEPGEIKFQNLGGVM